MSIIPRETQATLAAREDARPTVKCERFLTTYTSGFANIAAARRAALRAVAAIVSIGTFEAVA